MSIKPILFNTEMVRAILEGRKTVTRRVVKMNRPRIYKAACAAGRWSETFGGEIPDKVAEWYARKAGKPPCSTGDILWVRETWGASERECTAYRADGLRVTELGCENEPIWRPSIHMPKAAARLFLRVKSVRVERLREITIDGIEQEGVALTFPLKKLIESEHLKRFSNLWNSTIKPADLPRYGWDANPFVWVIEFERCERPENFLKEDADHEQ